jgi:hypothetical protein
VDAIASHDQIKIGILFRATLVQLAQAVAAAVAGRAVIVVATYLRVAGPAGTAQEHHYRKQCKDDFFHIVYQ